MSGCLAQGETIADVEGYIALVAQPECVGYRFANDLTVNLLLLYPDVKWHALEKSRLVVDNLIALRRIWDLTPETVILLEGWSVELERRSRLLIRYGSEAPIFPDMAHHTLDLPEAGRGLQGYQINFPRERYVSMKAALTRRLGPPTRQTVEEGHTASGSSTTGEVLEWLSERTVAVMKERGSAAASGYFVVITRAYLELIKTGRAAEIITRRPTPYSYPWFLQLIESFGWWPRNPDDLRVGSDLGSRTWPGGPP